MKTVDRKYMKTVDIHRKMFYYKSTIQLVARICLLMKVLKDEGKRKNNLYDLIKEERNYEKN